MANLKELCGNVPQSLLRVQTDYNVNVRMQASYNRRMQALDCERVIFEQCKRQRTQKRVRNSFSREEAGTCGSAIVTIRKSCTHTHQVCRTKRVF